ncbi:MAG: polysaccharide deacetylase family protein [Ignavibacterium sp.]
MKLFYNPSDFGKILLPNFIWQSKINKILLTFDDGPLINNSEKILSYLNKFNLKVLFFCIGDNVKKYPEIITEILSEGHSIGNHTFYHKNIRKLSNKEIAKEIEMTNNILFDKLGYKSEYFRPPYGRFKLSLSIILENYKMKNVMWSLLTYDYKNDFEVVKFAVLKYLKNNSIVALHDSIKSSQIILDSIDFIMDVANKNNYEIGNPTECLK